MYIRHIMSKLEGYHENIGGYYDSYRGISRVHWGLGVVQLTGELIDKDVYIYIETSDALNIPLSTHDSPTPELWFPPR